MEHQHLVMEKENHLDLTVLRFFPSKILICNMIKIIIINNQYEIQYNQLFKKRLDLKIKAMSIQVFMKVSSEVRIPLDRLILKSKNP